MMLECNGIEDVAFSRYSLSVIAESVLDAVNFVGGTIFDRASLRWDVTVHLPSEVDKRPLIILGARSSLFDTLDDEEGVPATVVAVSAAALCGGHPARACLRMPLVVRSAEVIVWNVDPAGEGMTAPIYTHRLSRAARLFKAHALRAAGNRVNELPLTEKFILLERPESA